ncbi:MAG: DUF5050 domain-containing protein [Lachnospiraceae bacterium]|nr:DUF5050 domain-containing protein [Lachnospiraceae bacterium]
MNKTGRNTVIILVLICIAATAAFIYSLLSQRVKLNDGYAVGNTAGNLNNNGLFCESEGVVFFSNPYDNGCLYSMTPDETGFKKLTTASVSSINADSHYVYYYLDSSDSGRGLGYMQRTYGIYRSSFNGRDVECLKRGNAITLQLCGNYLYYQFFDNQNKNGTQLFKIKIDKSEEARVTDYNVNPASCVNGLIYFNGTEDDHYLYSLNTAFDSVSLAWDGNVWNPVFENGYFYYMDIESDYRLCRYSPTDSTVEVLTDDRVDFFNVCGNYIYYQKSSEDAPALKRMYRDGSGTEVVAEGLYKNINATSRYVYFTGIYSDSPMYRTPLNGSVQVSTFDAAEAAARENR